MDYVILITLILIASLGLIFYSQIFETKIFKNRKFIYNHLENNKQLPNSKTDLGYRVGVFFEWDIDIDEKHSFFCVVKDGKIPSYGMVDRNNNNNILCTFSAGFSDRRTHKKLIKLLKYLIDKYETMHNESDIDWVIK